MRNCARILSFFVLAVVIGSCSRQEQPSTLKEYFKSDEAGVQTGGVKMIPIETPKGTFHVWTKRFGNNPRIKLLLLHGGPGATHEYFECMESFLPQEGIEFIYYDQLGSAYSDQPKDRDLWTTERFVEEVEQVRQALGLNKDNFYLLGHSWGGILAMEYALKYQQHLKGLIISNMLASAPEYDAYADNVLAKQMDPAVLKQIRAFEAKKDYDNPKYMDLLIPNYYMQHICRLKEWPDPVNRAFAKMNKDIYVLMQGPSEFGLSGRLEKWDRTADLKNISVPTLVVGAQYDTMDPEHMKWMSTQVANGSYLYCSNGSHMDMWDDQQVYMAGLIKFLKGVDEGKKTVAF
jgi:proline iminopeptidase